MPKTISPLIKLVFSDIDGTLLNANRELSNSTVEQVKRVVDHHGVKFVLVSARMPQAMVRIYKMLGLNTPWVCYNGALVLNRPGEDCLSSSILFSKGIDLRVVEWLRVESQKFDLHLSLYSYDTWVANRHDEWAQREENNTGVMATFSGISTLLNEWIERKRAVHKVLLMGDEIKISQVLARAERSYADRANFYPSKGTYLEVSPKEANKGSGCNLLMQTLGVNKCQTAAFGDNVNDIEMFRNVQLSVAMGNAPDAVKTTAVHIAPSNIADGVAVVLSKLFDAQQYHDHCLP